MSDHELRRPRYFLAWGLITALILVGVSTALALVFFVARPAPGTFYPLFPFGGFFALFWIFGIFLLIRWFFWPWRWHYPRRYWRYYDDSYYILRERYAKGEITKEQFEQMMHDLQAHS